MQILSRLLKTILFSAPLALGGCWFSAEPLLDSANASPIPFAGTYAAPDEGKPDAVIAPAGSGTSYSFTAGKERGTLHFLDIGNGWFVMQMVDPASEPEKIDLGPDLEATREPTQMATYQLLAYSGGVLLAYQPECDALAAGLSGIEAGELGCRIADIDALRRAGTAMASAIVAGEISAPPEVIRPVEQ